MQTLKSTTQTLTGTFTNIGSVIGPAQLSGTGDTTKDFSFLVVGIELDINDSKDFQIRALGVDKKTSKEYKFPIDTTRKDKTKVLGALQEFDEDIDDNQFFDWVLNNAIDAVQIQVRALTVGATAGSVLSAVYGLGYRQ